MDSKRAENLGRRKSLKGALYLFLVGELYMLFQTLRGDIANGIFFFIQAHKNVHYLIMVTTLFVLTYFLAQRNGKEILIRGRHFFLTPFKYGLVTICIVLAYGTLVGVFLGNKAVIAIMTTGDIISTLVMPYLRTILMLIVPLAIYSYYCGKKIKTSQTTLE
jgi:hypothetical protein